VLLLVLLFAPSAHSVGAKTVTVCSAGCDHTTIQAAIDAAATHAGDTIRVLDAIHTEAGVLVDKDVTSWAGAPREPSFRLTPRRTPPLIGC
jgi:pectin methylesterase-like acyl-CoA thioesterase